MERIPHTTVESRWGLQVATAQPVDKGFLSENTILTTIEGHKWFLKKYRYQKPKKVQQVHDAKRFFAACDIPIILPQPDQSGASVVEIDGHYYALFPFVAAHSVERGTMSDQQIISMGKMLGRIHLAGQHANIAVKRTYHLPDMQQSLHTLDRVKQQLAGADPDEMLSTINYKYQLVDDNQSNFPDFDFGSGQLIHGDYHDQNVFFDSHGNISHVFDLEKAQYAPRTYELFRSAVYCFFNTDFSQEAMRKFQLYVDAYLYINPLSHAELQAGFHLQYMEYISSTWVHEECYLRDNTKVRVFLEPHRRCLQYLTDHYQDFMDYLSQT